MTRKQFNEIVLKSARASRSPLYIIGSQAAYGSVNNIPPIALTSDEVDICPEELIDAATIEEQTGQGAEYWEQYGVYAHALEGADKHILTEGWKDRLVPLVIEDPVFGRKYKVFCLSLADICINKLCFSRPKDFNFVEYFINKNHLAVEELEKLANQVQERFKLVVLENLKIIKANLYMDENEGISV